LVESGFVRIAPSIEEKDSFPPKKGGETQKVPQMGGEPRHLMCVEKVQFSGVSRNSFTVVQTMPTLPKKRHTVSGHGTPAGGARGKKIHTSKTPTKSNFSGSWVPAKLWPPRESRCFGVPPRHSFSESLSGCPFPERN